MKYNLIFYIAKKTSYCEKAVRRAFSAIGGEPYEIVAATAPVALGEEVSRSLRICPLTVIVGGFDSAGDDNLTTVLSRVFSNSSLTLENMRRLNTDSGGRGYIVRYKTQILLALPDNPAEITALCGEDLLAFISEKLEPDNET